MYNIMLCEKTYQNTSDGTKALTVSGRIAVDSVYINLYSCS